MNCPRCNAPINTGAPYCPNCGYRLPNYGPNEFAQPTPAATKAKSNRVMGLAIILGAVVALIIALVGFAFFLQGSHDSPVNDSQADLSTVAEATVPAGASVFSWGYVSTDGAIGENLLISYDDGIVQLQSAKKNISVGEIYTSKDPEHSEAKQVTYKLGSSYFSGDWHDVFLTLFFVTPQGSLTHWGNEDANQLGLEQLCGLSLTDLCNAIHIDVGDDYVKATPAEVGSDVVTGGVEEASSDQAGKAEESSGATREEDEDVKAEQMEDTDAQAKKEAESVNAEEEKAENAGAEQAQPPSTSAPYYTEPPASAPYPFYGIWIGASQDEAEMNQVAENARANGFPDAAVYVTTDWTNLNAERWYVVSCGRYATEEQANEALGAAQGILEPSAYVKHTGYFTG